MKKLHFLAAGLCALASPALADWVFKGGPAEGGSNDICVFGYETETNAFVLRSDETIVVAMLIDTGWNLEDGAEGWAGVQSGAGDNTAFAVYRLDDVTMVGPLDGDQFLQILDPLFKNEPATVVAHDAQVWQLPAGASDVITQWTACIVPGTR